nr:hypothetical protein [Tanacetum cinerariifolium]
METYTTSITKTKAARYEIEGIEDMVPTLWSPTKVEYDKDALKGIKHWCERRKLWYRSKLNKFSKHSVYSTKKILGEKSVNVKKLHGYGHLDEIMVKRADRQLYKFKEGDIVDLHMNDIEDMLILAIQNKQLHLTKTILLTLLWLFADEMYKFSDRTLKIVQDELHHRVLDFDLGYNKEMERRKWTAIEKKRSAHTVELIDKQMRERRIIQNLERLVGIDHVVERDGGGKVVTSVYSTKKILGEKSVNVKKLHGYGHLDEIMVKRADRQLYKFKEGDIVDLHMNDIEDMRLHAPFGGAVEKRATCMPCEASDAKFEKCLFLIIPYLEQVGIRWTEEGSGGALLSELVHAMGLDYHHQSLDYRQRSVEESRHQMVRKT